VATLKDGLPADTTRVWTPKGRKHAPQKKRTDHKPKAKGFKAWMRRWWWVFVVVPASGMLLVLLMLMFVYSRLDLPKTPPPLQTTYIYDRDGNQIATLHAGVDRTIIPLSEMPKTLQNAVLAAEDADFYQHPGIDPVGIVRAAWTDLVSGGIVQGGSTITQQLVKNVYAGEYVVDPKSGEETYVIPPRNISQKVREALLAIKVEQEFSKDEILANYLNTVYFGRGAYGVQAAAQTYWQKDAEDLTILESAMLAGLVQSPSFYDPVEDPVGAKERRNYVLQRMVAEGFLTAERAAAMADVDVKTNPVEIGLNFPGKLGYFLDHTRRELIHTYTEGKVFGGGLQVTTTLDSDMQRMAEEAVAGRLLSPEDPDAALVAIDPRDGGIRAMYGGRNFNAEHVNLATGAGGTGRQSGSSFKVFTLVAALEQDYSLDSRWYGPSSITIPDPLCYTDGQPWELSNASDSESGTFTLLSATTHSVNTVFAQIASAVGPDAIVDVAHRMGIQSHLEPVCSITLGTQSVTPLEMTRAYATLAASGWRHQATPLQEVEDPNGETDTINSRGQQVLDANDADMATSALETVIISGTGTNANIGRPAAGKTGTNQEYRDAWFCGYTPQLAACVWMGYAEAQLPLVGIEGYSAVFGGTLPALIWHDFMAAATANMKVVDFHEPNPEGYTRSAPTPPPAPAPSVTPSPTEEPTPEPSPSPTESPSPSPTIEPTPTETTPPPTPSVSPPPTPSVSPTSGPSPTSAPAARARGPG
jgi:membrane peptidoglycan carboxypeptidase